MKRSLSQGAGVLALVLLSGAALAYGKPSPNFDPLPQDGSQTDPADSSTRLAWQPDPVAGADAVELGRLVAERAKLALARAKLLIETHGNLGEAESLLEEARALGTSTVPFEGQSELLGESAAELVSLLLRLGRKEDARVVFEFVSPTGSARRISGGRFVSFGEQERTVVGEAQRSRFFEPLRGQFGPVTPTSDQETKIREYIEENLGPLSESSILYLANRLVAGDDEGIVAMGASAAPGLAYLALTGAPADLSGSRIFAKDPLAVLATMDEGGALELSAHFFDEADILFRRRVAATTLQQAWPIASPTLGRRIELLEKCMADPRLLASCLEGFCRYLGNHRPTPTMLHCLADALDSRDDLLGTIATTLGTTGGAEFGPLWRRILESPRPDLRALAIRGLAGDPTSLDCVIPFADDPSENVRLAVLELAGYRLTDPRARDLLLRFANDPSSEVRSALLRRGAKYGLPLPALEALVMQEGIQGPKMADVILHSTGWGRPEEVQALWNRWLDTAGPEQLEALDRILEDSFDEDHMPTLLPILERRFQDRDSPPSSHQFFDPREFGAPFLLSSTTARRSMLVHAVRVNRPDLFEFGSEQLEVQGVRIDVPESAADFLDDLEVPQIRRLIDWDAEPDWMVRSFRERARTPGTTVHQAFLEILADPNVAPELRLKAANRLVEGGGESFENAFRDFLRSNVLTLRPSSPSPDIPRTYHTPGGHAYLLSLLEDESIDRTTRALLAAFYSPADPAEELEVDVFAVQHWIATEFQAVMGCWSHVVAAPVGSIDPELLAEVCRTSDAAVSGHGGDLVQALLNHQPKELETILRDLVSRFGFSGEGDVPYLQTTAARALLRISPKGRRVTTLAELLPAAVDSAVRKELLELIEVAKVMDELDVEGGEGQDSGH